MSNIYPIKKKPLHLFGLIIFFLTIPLYAQAVTIGDVIQATDGNYYTINSIKSNGSDNQSYSRVTSEGGTPCQAYNYYNGSDLRIYTSGYDDGSQCRYTREVTFVTQTTAPLDPFSVVPFSYGLGLIMASWIAGLSISQVFRVMRVIT